jgi:DNA-binding NarL/FixJ family response regulator
LSRTFATPMVFPMSQLPQPITTVKDVLSRRMPSNALERIEIDEHEDYTNSTYVGVIDPYLLNRECISRSLQLHNRDMVVKSFSSLNELTLSNTQVDILLYFTHTGLPSIDCLHDILQKMREIAPVIIVGDCHDSEIIMGILHKGARGYIPVESTSLPVFGQILNLVKAGGIFVPVNSLTVQHDIDSGKRIFASADALTPREKTVLSLLKSGKPNKVIAYELGLSASTIKLHIRSIMRKLNVRNRTEAVSCAYTGDYARLLGTGRD